MGIRIPTDLTSTDLSMAEVTRVLEIRAILKENHDILEPPRSRKELAERRIAWAKDAEKAVRSRQPEPDYPKGR